MEACVSSTQTQVEASTSGLAWKWILQKLVDVPEFGVAFINELITTHVKDIEEPHCWPLLERVALRNLEEMVVSNQIDFDAIPLLKGLIRQNLSSITDCSIKQQFNKELVLRVQTEVVLSVLREDVNDGERDWSSFASELERVFTEETDNGVLERKRELSALLKSRNQTKAVVAAYFEEHSLQNLKNDLLKFIDEKKKSLKAMFLDQLSRDFLNPNGTPFPEELRGVEKIRKVDTRANQANVGTVNLKTSQVLKDTPPNSVINPQNVEHEAGNGLEVDKIGDENIMHVHSGRKRLKRKLLCSNDDVSDDDPEELEEYNAGTKKARKMTSTSLVYLETVLHHDVSESALPRSSSLKDGFLVKHEIESLEQRLLLQRGKEGMAASGNFRSKSLRGCIPHVSASKKKPKVCVGEPGRTYKPLAVSDVESDAETQRLSIDGEEKKFIKRNDGDDHLKEMAESSSRSESGSDQGDSQKIVATGVIKKETSGLPSQRSTSVDRRKEAPVLLSEAKVAQQREIEKFLIKNDFIPLDAQGSYKFEFLDVGNDGHEDVCHMCGLHGKLVCCDGCPISMHFKCTEVIGLRLPKDEEEWYCPICLSMKAAQAAAEATKIAAAAQEKLKAFMKDSIKKLSSSEGDALHQLRQKKTVKKSDSRANPSKADDIDTTSKVQQQNEGSPRPKYTEAQHDPDPPKSFLLTSVLMKSLHHLKQRENRVSESRDQELSPVRKVRKIHKKLSKTSPKSLRKNRGGSFRESSVKCLLFNEDAKKTERAPNTPDQSISRRRLLAASTSGQKTNGKETSARSSKSKGPMDDSDEEGIAQEAEVQELRNGTDGFRKAENDKHGRDLDEDGGEKLQKFDWNGFLSGRRKVPGLRRKPLPWTREEEDALKEGVRRISNNGEWGFRWKQILEFGQGRFDPSRTDVDLKDKWRNLAKGVS